MNRAAIMTAPFIIGGITALGVCAPAHATEGTEPSPDTSSADQSMTTPTVPVPSSTESSETPGPDQATEPTTSPAAPETGIGTAIRTELWYLPTFPLNETPTNVDPRIWSPDQEKFNGLQYGWCQVDTYPADAPDFGPTLSKGEDYGYTIEWSFIICGTAPVTPEPEPTPVVTPPPEVVAPAIEPVAQTTPVAAPVQELAFTGPVTGWMAPVGAAALLGGLLLFWRNRKAQGSGS